MCAKDPSQRINSFSKIEQEILAGKFADIPFTEDELSTYRDFASDLSSVISKVEQSAKYFDSPQDIEKKLEDAYRKVMLEDRLPSNTLVIRCFLNGSYYFSNRVFMEVANLRRFIELLRSCSKEKKSIVLSNIFARLDASPRYQEEEIKYEGDDIPF